METIFVVGQFEELQKRDIVNNPFVTFYRNRSDAEKRLQVNHWIPEIIEFRVKTGFEYARNTVARAIHEANIFNVPFTRIEFKELMVRKMEVAK